MLCSVHVIQFKLPCKWCTCVRCATHQFYNSHTNVYAFHFFFYMNFSFAFSSQSGTYFMHNNHNGISRSCTAPTRQSNIKPNRFFLSAAPNTHAHTRVNAFRHECKYCLNFHFRSLKKSLQFVKGKTVAEDVNCPKLINLMVAAFVCTWYEVFFIISIFRILLVGSNVATDILRNSCMIIFYSWIHDMLWQLFFIFRSFLLCRSSSFAAFQF